MTPADKKKRMEINNDNQKVKEKRLLISSLSSCLSCIIAGAIPKSLINPKKVNMTVATATIPKSSGDNKRDRIAVIIKDITIPAYFDMPV